MKLENPPTLASEFTSLPVTSWRRFARDLHDGRIDQICILSDVERMKCEAEELKQLVSEGVDALSAKSKKECFDEQSWDSLKSCPFYEVLRTPATFNRCVTHLLRSVRDFAPSYFDDVFIYSRVVDGKSEVEMHKEHLRKLFALMRKHKLYANLKKCIFGASEIPVLGCLVGKNGVRPDPGKVRVINEWPTPSNVKD
ncbi:hypothetical protein PR003_g2162 [Phytophthora rubi]|uniref:Reverse transcriptase domain-containing protein n=1 Tax=Phytophthora rubi TaxID=129364 RepID=A0A6A3NRD3_9STRA|nr:hypothetical protein PR001_g5110 [Phytophthora rubi]KAE9356727.1 hypothetical protein PR003_g2162 [Phytophthora rubi]